MLSAKILKLLEPDKLMLEYLTYIIAQKPIDLIEQIKTLSKAWISLKMDQGYELIRTIITQINDLDNASKYITLSQRLDLYETLYKDTIYDLIIKQNRIYDIYLTVKKLEEENINSENITEIINHYIIELQEKIEKIDILNDNAINILNNDALSNIHNTELPKYISFIPEIDLLLNGFSQGLYLFAGVLGSGKSSLLLNLSLGFNIFVNLFEDDLKEKITEGLIPSVLYITLENTYEQTIIRLKSIINDSSPIKLTENKTPLKDLYNEIDISRLIIVNLLYENATMTNIEKIIKQIYYKGYHPTIILVDYMDEIYISENIEHRHKLGLISRFLRNLAMKYNSVVITATQMNRKAMEGKLGVAYLSESIEHAKKADAVISLVTGKTELDKIKNNDYKSLYQDSKIENIPSNNIFAPTINRLNERKLPAMFISTQKNRYSLILGDIGILSSPNSNIGFTSLIECLNFDISLNITNMKSKYINNNIIKLVDLTFDRLFIKNVKDIYNKQGTRYIIDNTNDELSKRIIFEHRLPYINLLENIRNTKDYNNNAKKENIENNINNQNINQDFIL